MCVYIKKLFVSFGWYKTLFFLKKIAKGAQKSTEKDLIEHQILNKELLKYHLPSKFLFVHFTCFPEKILLLIKEDNVQVLKDISTFFHIFKSFKLLQFLKTFHLLLFESNAFDDVF